MTPVIRFLEKLVILIDGSLMLLYDVTATSKSNQPSLTCGLWVLTGLLAFIIIEKVFSFDKDNEDNIECEPNIDNGVKKSLSIRRKKSSFILNNLTVNYGSTPELLKPLVNGVTTNNNNMEKTESPSLEKKPSNIHVSILMGFLIFHISRAC